MASFLPTNFTTPSSKGAGVPVQQPQFIFPLLKSGEILLCLTELGIDYVGKPELTEPQRHKDKIRKVFWQLLDICCGVSEEELQKRASAITSTTTKDKTNPSSVAYPDLHEDWIEVLFFLELRACMTTCGLYDFSWKDLHAPTSKRLRTQLSAIINMAKFREEQLKVYAELNEPRAQLLLTLEEIHKEHEALTDQLEHVQAKSSQKLEQVKQVQGECEELEGEIARHNKLQAAKRELAATLKREANDLKDELESATWALQETQVEEENLMGQVVSSPDRRIQELANKKERLAAEKEESRELQEQLQTTKANTVQLQQAIKQVRDTIVSQKQVLEEAQRYEQLMGKVDEITKNVEMNQQKILQIQGESEQVERGLLRSEEKVIHMRKQGKMKLEAAHDRLEMAKEQLLMVEKERREGMAKVELGEQEVRALEAQMKAEKEQTEKDIALLISAYREMENAFLARNEKRMQAIDVTMS